MSGFKMINAASEKEGACTLLESMLQVPPVQKALDMLEQGVSIAGIGSWLQRDILAAFENEQQRGQQLQSDLEFQKREVAMFQRIIEKINADPLEEKTRRAEAARAAAEKDLRDAQREIADLKQQRERELAAKTREIGQLQKQIAELNKLTAKQHRKLQELTGANNNN